MKSITPVFMTYIFVSYMFYLANAKSFILGGVSHGETVTDSSRFNYEVKKNKYTEKVCKENNYNGHFLTERCAAFCNDSTIKNRASRQISLPDGTPCDYGKTCKDGYCGERPDFNAQFIADIERAIKKPETLKKLSPKMIADIKSDLRKFKPEKVGEVHPYIMEIFSVIFLF